MMIEQNLTKANNILRNINEQYLNDLYHFRLTVEGTIVRLYLKTNDKVSIKENIVYIEVKVKSDRQKNLTFTMENYDDFFSLLKKSNLDATIKAVITLLNFLIKLSETKKAKKLIFHVNSNTSQSRELDYCFEHIHFKYCDSLIITKKHHCKCELVYNAMSEDERTYNLLYLILEKELNETVKKVAAFKLINKEYDSMQKMFEETEYMYLQKKITFILDKENVVLNNCYPFKIKEGVVKISLSFVEEMMKLKHTIEPTTESLSKFLKEKINISVDAKVLEEITQELEEEIGRFEVEKDFSQLMRKPNLEVPKIPARKEKMAYLTENYSNEFTLFNFQSSKREWLFMIKNYSISPKVGQLKKNILFVFQKDIGSEVNLQEVASKIADDIVNSRRDKHYMNEMQELLTHFDKFKREFKGRDNSDDLQECLDALNCIAKKEFGNKWRDENMS